jgi:hypothetical protein
MIQPNLFARTSAPEHIQVRQPGHESKFEENSAQSYSAS